MKGDARLGEGGLVKKTRHFGSGSGSGSPENSAIGLAQSQMQLLPFTPSINVKLKKSKRNKKGME